MLITTVEPATIAVALGQSAPPPASVTEEQWQMFIDDALMLIQDRTTSLSVVESSISQAKIDYVVREAVVAHIRRPDDATQVTIAVDDGSTSKTYRSSAGRVSIIDDWWTMLGLSPRKGRAFEVDTAPESAGVYGVDYWWSTPYTSETIP